MGTAIRRFLDVCYDGSPDLATWSKDLLPAVAGAARWNGGSSITFVSLDEDGAHDIKTDLWDRAEELRAYAEACGDDPGVQRAWDDHRVRPFRVISLSQLMGAPARSLVGPLRAPDNLVDQMGLTVEAGTIGVSLPMWEGGPKPPSRRMLLRLQRHMATAAAQRQRRMLVDDAVAVFDARGRTLEATSLGPSLLARAESLAKAIAEDIDGHGTDEVESIWDSLWDGGYAIARFADTDGKRMFVLRRVLPAESRPALTLAERRVVARAMRGASLKVVASDLGTTASTVSTHLANALRKLGLEDRVQLVRVFGGVGEGAAASTNHPG